jgi:hypothetical protein
MTPVDSNTEQPENPPAFPRTGEGVGNPRYDEPGMTLRDWFAGQALPATSSVPHARGMSMVQVGSPMHPELAAKAAYAFADAMLNVRRAANKEPI